MNLQSLLVNEETESIYKKIMDLNDLVWENKAADRLEGWLGNFKKEEEQKIALYLLSKFTYYNESEIKSLMRTSYKLLENKVFLDLKGKMNLDDEYVVEKNCYFVGTWENPVKSGAHLLYHFAKINGLPEDLFKNTIDDIPKSAKYVIFFDDMAGSGRQASSFWFNRVVRERKSLVNTKFYYLVLVANEKGISYILNKTGLPVIPSVVLDRRYEIFSNNSIYFTNDNFKRKAAAMCKKYGESLLPGDGLGFNNSQLLIGFHHNVPDNTLPIIWSEENEWNPIFPRNEVFV